MKEPLMDSIFRVRERTNTMANFANMCLILCWKEQLSTHHRKNLLFIEILTSYMLDLAIGVFESANGIAIELQVGVFRK